MSNLSLNTPDIWKVWYNHPLDGSEVWTYVFANSFDEAMKKAHFLDMKYCVAQLAYKKRSDLNETNS